MHGTSKQTAFTPFIGTLLGVRLSSLRSSLWSSFYALDFCSSATAGSNSFTRIVLHYSLFRCLRHWCCLLCLWSSYLLHLPLFSDLRFGSLTLALHWQSWSITSRCSQASTRGDQFSLFGQLFNRKGTLFTLW